MTWVLIAVSTSLLLLQYVVFRVRLRQEFMRGLCVNSAGGAHARADLVMMCKKWAAETRALNSPGVPPEFVEKHNIEAAILDHVAITVVRDDLDWASAALDEMDRFVQRECGAKQFDREYMNRSLSYPQPCGECEECLGHETGKPHGCQGIKYESPEFDHHT